MPSTEEHISQSLTREERKVLKHEARMEERQKEERHKKLRRLGRFAIGIAILALFLWWLATKVAFQPGGIVANLGNAHIKTVDEPHEPYNSIPPTSGPHVGNIAPWGVHTEPILDELQVHNLEDGGVAVQYNCEELAVSNKQQVCENLITQLRAIVDRFHSEVILAPYPKLDVALALTAWNRIDKWTPTVRSDNTIALDIQRVKKFIKAYRGVDHHVRYSR